LSICGIAAWAGGAAAAAYLFWSKFPPSAEPLRPLPLSASTRVVLGFTAVLVGGILRFVVLNRVPEPMWVDDLSLIRPALGLHGSLSDFADTIREAPYGVVKPYGTVGVLYLEAYRASLELWGTTVFGVRFPSALAGAVSLLTGALLGRALLPAGGGMLSALILAGLRWQLILSRWAWSMIVLAPIIDLSALLLIAASRRRSRWLALGAGLVAGVGAHVYLSAWAAGVALTLFALWPVNYGVCHPDERDRVDGRSRRMARAAAFVCGFAIAAAPIFLFHEGRRADYFSRTTSHNVFLEIRRTSSLMPPLAAAVDAVAAPWFLADPSARNDLPERRRLPLLLGVAVAIALLRALRRPRDAVSGLILSHAVATLLAVVAGGQAHNPNGSRFAYLTSIAGIAGAAGVMWLVSVALRRGPGVAHLATVVAVGVISVQGVLGARDALLVWPERRETFDAFSAQDTLIGRAASRWGRYGAILMEPGIGHSSLAYGAIKSYSLDADTVDRAPAPYRSFRVRIANPTTPADSLEGERLIEVVQDEWGREWARVLARRAPEFDRQR
jgi:hypothetical protein